MYTQCDQCKAIFEVSMREVTVASGKLRCGECNVVFDAMASLSTTMPESFSDSLKSSNTNNKIDTKADLLLPSHKRQESYRPEINKPALKERAKDITDNIDSKWLKAIALSLATLLLAQVLYNNRHYFSDTPIRAPDKIEMLNNNVFAHPNEDGVLLISASIENHAQHAQPYPVLEVRLTNTKSKLVALRRFKPSEYLENYDNNMLMETNKPTNLKLKIADPGNDASRFQFKFL